MTITLEIAPEVALELEGEAARRGVTLEEMTQQALMRTLIKGLKNQPVPQSLDELQPRRSPPPGRTAIEMVTGQWPGDETDAEINRALEELSECPCSTRTSSSTKYVTTPSPNVLKPDTHSRRHRPRPLSVS